MYTFDSLIQKWRGGGLVSSFVAGLAIIFSIVYARLTWCIHFQEAFAPFVYNPYTCTPTVAVHTPHALYLKRSKLCMYIYNSDLRIRLWSIMHHYNTYCSMTCIPFLSSQVWHVSRRDYGKRQWRDMEWARSLSKLRQTPWEMFSLRSREGTVCCVNVQYMYKSNHTLFFEKQEGMYACTFYIHKSVLIIFYRHVCMSMSRCA